MILALDDFKQQYRGSYLGIFWAILRPVLFVTAIWFVFSYGFKGARETNGHPFVLYLLCGYFPWLLFSDALLGGMNSIVSRKHMLKQPKFQPSILAVIKFLSALMLHGILLSILVVLMIGHQYYPSIYWLQLPFYIICMMVLVLGLSWFTSSLRVFSQDISQLVGVVLQVGFWVTPIFWNISSLPPKIQPWLSTNPMVFIIEGYRGTFLNEIWFWERPTEFAVFGTVTAVLLVLGSLTFGRLRSHFGDVL